MTAVPTDARFTAEQREHLARIEAAEEAPESFDPDRWPDAVLVDDDWISPRRELEARDVVKAWADAAQNAGCPSSFVARMRAFVRVHQDLADAAIAVLRPADVAGDSADEHRGGLR